MKGSSSRRVQERDEGATLLWQYPNTLDRTESHLRQQLINRSIRRQVAHVNCAALANHDHHQLVIQLIRPQIGDLACLTVWALALRPKSGEFITEEYPIE